MEICTKAFIDSKKIKLLCNSAIFSFFLVGVSQQALAWDWASEAKVTRIASSGFPDQVQFMVDVAVGSCPAGAWLTYLPTGSSEARAIASAQFAGSQLMTAKAANSPIAIYGNNSGCTVQHIHMVK